jgi:hypothetical protein
VVRVPVRPVPHLGVEREERHADGIERVSARGWRCGLLLGRLLGDLLGGGWRGLGDVYKRQLFPLDTEMGNWSDWYTHDLDADLGVLEEARFAIVRLLAVSYTHLTLPTN